MSFEVVRFERSNYLSQFEQLPKCFEGKNKQSVLISRNSESTTEATIQHSKLVFPYTVLVTSTLEDMPLPHVLSASNRYIKFHRYPKAVQGVLLKSFFEEHGLSSGYYHLDTYQCEGKSLSQSIPDDTYIIKPENGARSLAIIEIDTTKMTMDEFFGNVTAVQTKANDWEAEELRKKEGSVTDNSKNAELQISEQPTNKNDARNKFFLEMIERTGLKYKAGDENHKNEAINQFFLQGQTIQRKCPFEDFIELRVIRSMNGELLIVTREDLQELWSGTTTIVTDDNVVKIMGKDGIATSTHLLDNIRDSLSHPEFPGMYGSIDVWVSPKDRAWGIFEFQPQYNGENIPSEIHHKFMRDCINEFIDFVK